MLRVLIVALRLAERVPVAVTFTATAAVEWRGRAGSLTLACNFVSRAIDAPENYGASMRSAGPCLTESACQADLTKRPD
jgi:hypothetical protein